MKFNKILCLCFLFILGLTFSCRNDSGEINLQVSNNLDSIQLNKKRNAAQLFLEKNHTDSAEISVRSLYNLAAKNNNHFYLGKSHAIQGYLFLNKNQADSAYFHLNAAVENFRTINDSLNAGKNLVNMAIAQANQGDYSGSEFVATQALTYLENIGNKDYISSVYNCLAISSNAQKNHSEAVYWYQKTLNSATDLYSKNLYKNNMAVSYLHLKDYKKSAEILTELLNENSLNENPKLEAKVIDNLAFSKWKQNPQINVEKELKDALEIRLAQKDRWGQIASHAHLADYFQEKNRKNAIDHAKKMYHSATSLDSPDDRLEALQKLILMESPEQSKSHAILYAALNDSLVTARNQAKDKFAKIRYDSEKNREENEILRAETAEQQVEIERRKLYGVISIFGIILICSGFLGFNRIQKIKNQKRLDDEIHATESKIAGKVHDDIANNIYGLMVYFEGNSKEFHAKKKNLILEKLDGIYQLSRNISRENSPIETGADFADELLNLFSYYKSNSTNLILIGFENLAWEKLQSEAKIQLYKVVQELLTNMKKHSQASLVVLKFQFTENNFTFFYTDNGIGITENQFITKNGILIMENRIEKINGTISFAPEPNKGLKVNISVPI